MNILGFYLVIQLWSNSIGFIAINQSNSLMNKKINEKGYYSIKNNSLYPKNDILIKVLKAFIPFYYCIKGIMLIKESKNIKIDEVIKKKIQNGEIKEVIEISSSKFLFDDKEINYNGDKFKHHIPQEPYKSIPFEKSHIEKDNVVIEMISDEELERYNGITPFVVKENQSQLNIKQLNEILRSNEDFENYVLNTPLPTLESAYETMRKVIDFRTRKEEKDSLQKLELKKEDKAA